MDFICVDGKMIHANQPVLHADNRGFRYGDGLFETMKMVNGKIPLSSLHFDRLFFGLQLLEYSLPSYFSRSILEQNIQELVKKNKCDRLARIRLSVFRGNGGLHDNLNATNYLIECSRISETMHELNEKGWIIDILPRSAKSCDLFSNIKSASFLLYSMAALYAEKQLLNECLVLNTNGSIADGSITNVFAIKAGSVFTPSLANGCVSGVMRKYLIDCIKKLRYDVAETTISIQDLLNADEVFLTNAIQGIKWVKVFRNKEYTNTQTKVFYTEFVKPIFK